MSDRYDIIAKEAQRNVVKWEPFNRYLAEERDQLRNDIADTFAAQFRKADSLRTCATCIHCESRVGDSGGDDGCEAGVGRPFGWRAIERDGNILGTFSCSLHDTGRRPQ